MFTEYFTFNFFLQTVHTSNALVGTCKMGASTDNLSVVGADLRVHGIKGEKRICLLIYSAQHLLYKLQSTNKSSTDNRRITKANFHFLHFLLTEFIF